VIYTEQQAREAFIRYDTILTTTGVTDAVGTFLDLLRDEGGEVEHVHRCTVCGKWSHAKRRPPHHKRFIVNPDEPVQLEGTARTAATAAEIASDLELTVYETIEPTWAGDPRVEEDPGGVWVYCGPFATYAATREDANAHA
jgi:hypothetical protein